MRRCKKGFTIIEILAVTIIIALLGAVLVPSVFKKFGKAKSQIAKVKLAKVEGAIVEFQMACGRIPTDGEGLGALLTAPADVQDKWDGPYLKKSDMIDPWDRPILYMQQGQINVGGYDVFSYGADGQAGGDGENADIFND